MKSAPRTGRKAIRSIATARPITHRRVAMMAGISGMPPKTMSK